MKYVYVKDSEGFVSKKAETCLEPDEIVISLEEYRKLSGDEYYEKNFLHGGKREGAGRKIKYSEPLKYQIRVSQQEKEFIMCAREKHLDYGRILKENS